MGDEGTYKIKRINFCGREDVLVFCQNINGPCPLLAIANVLSLRNQLNVSRGATEMSTLDLMTLVAERILDSNSSPASGAGRTAEAHAFEANLRANITDAMEALSKLGEPGSTGMDVNIRFNSPTGFELTREVAVFDLLGIPLLHGWLVDPQDVVTSQALGSKTYNQAVEQVITSLDSQPSFGGPKGSFKAPSFSASSFAPSPTKPTPPPATDVDLLGLDSLTLNPTTAEAPETSQSTVQPIATTALDDLVDSAPAPSAASPQADGPATPADESTPVKQPLVASPDTSSDLLMFDGLNIAGGTPPITSPPPEPAASVTALTLPVSQSLAGARTPASASKTNKPPLHETLAIREFLEGNASQLTVYGIAQIAGTMNENTLAVFFRNNHFNCMFKHGRSLYLLITDQGYLGVNEVVWERLDTIDGDTQLCGPDFLPHKARAQVPIQTQQVNMDAFTIPPEALAGLSEEDAAAIVEAAGAFLPASTAPATAAHNAGDNWGSTGGGDAGTYQPPLITWQGEPMQQGQQQQPVAQQQYQPQAYQPQYQQPQSAHGNVDADLALALQLQEEEMQEARRVEEQQARAQQQRQQQSQQQVGQGGHRASPPAPQQQHTSAQGGQQYYSTGPAAHSRTARQVQPEPKKEESSCTIM